MLVRRIGITFVGAGLVASSLFAGSASSQETTTTTTTTTAVPATTTTAVPATTTTAPATTTTTVALPPVVETPELFGDTIASGQLDVAIGWFESTPNNCVETIDLATSGQVNAVTDEDGNLGAVYGMADSAGGSAAVLMIGFGAVPRRCRRGQHRRCGVFDRRPGHRWGRPRRPATAHRRGRCRNAFRRLLPG